MPGLAISAAPCGKCPFRKDVPIFLRAGRRAEIVESLMNQETFWCHNTVDYGDGEEEPSTYGSAECAGALKALMAAGGTTQSARIAERLGLADLDRVETHPVEVWSLDEWPLLVEGSTGDAPVWREDPDEIETCSVVEDGCEAPAGYRGAGGGVVHGTVAAENHCLSCGEPVCDNCMVGPNCLYCSDEED